MEFVSPIISPIVESLLVPIKKHLGFLVSYTKYAKDTDARMKQLKDTEKDMQTRKDAADAKSHEVPHGVARWLDDVKKMDEKAKSIPTGDIGCFNVAKRYKAGKQSFNILKEINDLKTRESEIKWTNEQKPLAKVASTSTSAPVVGARTQTDFGSRDLIFKNALKSLDPNNETQKMIALCGMAGVGKTTMMEQIKKAVEDSKMFNWVVKVVLGEDTNSIALQQAIAECITGKDLTERTKNVRADRLREQFKNISEDGKKKILVIMDDLWKEVDLKDVGLTSPLPNGFKLLFTSRFENVCTQMGVRKTDSIFKVDVLNDAEVRTLFFDSVEENGDDPEFQKIGEDIVKKCGGLPIAIVTIARSLRGQTKEAWEDASSRLEHGNLDDLHSITQRIFEMSYENLKKDEDKSIFLLSGLFPDDFNIPTEELFRYGWGLNIFKNVKTLAIARRKMKICVDNLIHANLLTESDREGCVKMHDLVRAFVLSNFSKVKQASIVNHDNMLTEDSNESYERILLKCTGMYEFPAQFNYPNLSLLILMDGDRRLQFPDDFNERMEILEVLSYERMHTPLLGVTFEYATKLRTLCLHSCLLGDDISFIGSLSNLETLSFADCEIRKLPSTIGKLKKLKLLDLTGCADLCIDDGVFQYLVSLEELYMRASSGRAIRFTDSNCDELEILSNRLFALELEFFENKAQPRNVSFKNLKKFMISIGCELSCSEKYSLRNTLKLVADCHKLLECKINELFKETEELELQVEDMNCLDDVSMHQSFCNLRVLTVCNCADLRYLFTVPVASGLKKLERLTITDCPVLKELVGGNSGGEVIKFQELKFMHLEGLPCITCIYPDNNNASPKQPFLNKEVAIPKLEKLDISMMENLMQIWPCEITTSEKNNVSMVREIRVIKCDSLVNLFPSNPLPLLSHLEELEVRNCGSIEVLFNIDLERGYDEMEQESSRLRKIKVDELGKLRELWRMKGVNKSVNGFKAVEIITIIGCKRFTNIFTPTTTNFDLGALTTYGSINTGQDLEERESKNKWVERSQEINVKSKGVGCRCFPLPAPKANVILKGDTSEMDDNILNVTYTSHLLHTCHHHLQYLELNNDPRVEVVFEMLDSPSSRELATIGADREKSLLLPYLKFLQLAFLKEMSHVWKCNWNEFLIPQQPPLEFPFQNLTTIWLWECNKIKYLFSPLMAKFLSNLKDIHLSSCDGIEEVVSSRDDENETCTSSQTNNNTFFPHLDTLELVSLPSLKRIDGGDQFQGAQVIAASWSLCQYPRMLDIEGCNALSGSLIPWYAVGQMKKLEELTIRGCVKIMEVFESETINNHSSNNVDEGSAISGASTLISPGLQNITNTVVPQLSNLKLLSIKGCDLLRHVFTFSTLESLKQLNKLKVVDCKEIRVIVKEGNGTTASSSSKDVVVFPRVETLELVNLPNLEGFFLGGMNDFRWPLLDHVILDNCPRMKVFTTGHSTASKLKYIHTSLGKHSLESGLNFRVTTTNQHDQTTFPSLDPTVSKGMPWSFHNLIEIGMEDTDVKTIIPSNVLLQLQKLEKIHLNRCYLVEEAFEVVGLEGTNNSGFNESQTIVNIPNLRQVELMILDSLKYLWKNHQWMVLEFPNLTTVSIQWCKRVEHVFTCSMVGSLLQLRDLHISKCENIEVIVKEDEEECDAKVNHDIILLPRLTSLTLERLPNLKGFCLGKETFSLPSLDTLEINECPAIMVFTVGRLDTPKLKVIDTTFGMCYAREDLNSFIKTKQQEGLEF